ncbi:DUF6573 family protein [Pseudarthrobacter sp. J47]
MPVAITSEAWEEGVAWPEPAGAQQNENERVRELLRASYQAAIAAGHTGADRIPVRMWRVPASEPGAGRRSLVLHLHIGPGDTSLPVVTIMLPGQD